MYISITGSPNNKDVYIYQSYRKENGKTSSRIYKKRKQVIIRIFKSLPAFDKMFSNDGGDTNRDGWQ